MKVVLKRTKLPDVKELLDNLGFGECISREERIIIKPNLIENRPPPVTTPIDIITSLIKYIQSYSKAKIIIAEGSGGSPTKDCFSSLGYDNLRREFGVELVDLNSAIVVIKQDANFLGHTQIEFPQIIENSYLISIPTLKEHTMATVTLSLKNMFGLYPGKIYGGGGFGGSWKSKVHDFGVDNSIVDINLCKKPDLSIIDGRVGMLGSHLTGKVRKFNVIIAGYDPVAVDTVGARILGHNQVRHITMCEEKGIGSKESKLYEMKGN